ncbi:MAG TPA: RDD family protein [Candidatus Acidoferrales bacterium]|nr:RDD family protein [Candidatus Acidoferrales bacterium]
MIQICSQCGAVSNQDVEVCPFCEFSFSSVQPAPATAPAAASNEPEWRQEVARRLEVYRSRRPHAEGERSQSPLPFASERPAVITTATAPRTIARLRPTQHVEIHVSQPQLDFSVVENFRVQPTAASVPAAELPARRFAGILDAAAVSAVFLLFFAMFRSLGGQLSFAKTDIAIYAFVFFLIYALYFSLFTLFSGATPGMTARGLSVVALDGNLPENSQLLWRTLGYLLSGGTLLLGFLWALWDEAHLTWHDRISRTYVTSAPPEGFSDES